MSTSRAIHEDRMNQYGGIHPRVGGGVGVGVRGRKACMPLVSLGAHLGVGAARHLASQPHATMHGSLRSQVIACQ